MTVHFCAHTSLHTRVFSVSPPSTPPAYRTVQNRFPIISTTCLFNNFLALTVITLLLLIVAITGSAVKVHETRKQCFRAVNAELLTKETFWVEFAIPMYLFGFPVSTTTNTLPKEIFIPCYFCQVRTHQIPIAFRPESFVSPHQFIIGLKEFITTNTVRRTHWFNCSQTGTIQTTFSPQVVSLSQS